MTLSATELMVTEAEAGGKLLRFLERRLDPCPPAGELHRWIRTGQVRVNKKRAQPYMALHSGDMVRVPPFAVPRAVGGAQPETGGAQKRDDGTGAVPFLGDDMPVLAMTADVLALSKPAGLAAQKGSGLADSVAHRLEQAFAEAAFRPAVVHRLDRETSGVLLAARSHAGAKALSAAFASPGAVGKEYLAVVAASVPCDLPYLCMDTLVRAADSRGYELTRCSDTATVAVQEGEEWLAAGLAAAGRGKAVLLVREEQDMTRALRRHALLQGATVLLVRLLTGKKHQIRAQLAHRGFPLVGDTRYGGMAFPHLLLHARRLVLPDGTIYEAPLPAFWGMEG